MWFSWQLYGVDYIILISLNVRKLRIREAKWPAQGHTASTGQKWASHSVQSFGSYALEHSVNKCYSWGSQPGFTSRTGRKGRVPSTTAPLPPLLLHAIKFNSRVCNLTVSWLLAHSERISWHSWKMFKTMIRPNNWRHKWVLKEVVKWSGLSWILNNLQQVRKHREAISIQDAKDSPALFQPHWVPIGPY